MGQQVDGGRPAGAELKQWGSFPGRDNQRELMILLQRLGDGHSEVEGGKRRAAFLQGLIRSSKNGFADKMARMEPCDAVAAYFAMVHITGVLGVPMDNAARRLERIVTKL